MTFDQSPCSHLVETALQSLDSSQHALTTVKHALFRLSFHQKRSIGPTLRDQSIYHRLYVVLQILWQVIGSLLKERTSVLSRFASVNNFKLANSVLLVISVSS